LWFDRQQRFEQAARLVRLVEGEKGLGQHDSFQGAAG
jgi:hypothetical protein